MVMCRVPDEEIDVDALNEGPLTAQDYEGGCTGFRVPPQTPSIDWGGGAGGDWRDVFDGPVFNGGGAAQAANTGLFDWMF